MLRMTRKQMTGASLGARPAMSLPSMSGGRCLPLYAVRRLIERAQRLWRQIGEVERLPRLGGNEVGGGDAG